MANILKAFLLIFLATFDGQASAIDSLKVVQFDCTQEGKIANCRIQTAGKVAENDVLFLSSVSDSDIAKSGDIELGRTGYFLNSPFYAMIIPRIYSLEKILGQDSPTISIRAESILGDSAGLSQTQSEVRIISLSDAKILAVRFITIRIIALIALGVLFAFAFTGLRRDVADGWQWPWIGIAVFVPSSAFFILSMVKIPRMLIPSVLSPVQYYLLHAGMELAAIWALTDLIRRVNFTDRASIIPLSFEPYAARISSCIHHGSAIVGILLLANHSKFGIKFAHSYAVFLQSVGLLLIPLIRLGKTPIRRLLSRSMPGSLLVLLSTIISAIVFARDAVTYLWLHESGTQYYIHYMFGLTLAAIGYRSFEFRRCLYLSDIFSKTCRQEISSAVATPERGDALCKTILQVDTFARVSLVSIKNRNSFLVASGGSLALPPDDTPRPPGPMVEIAMSGGGMFYAPDLLELGADLASKGIKRACLIIAIKQMGEVIAALAIMAEEGRKISPTKAKILELAASALSLEVEAIIEKTVLEKIRGQFESVAKCTAGIVFENTDAWGRIKKISGISRRTIVTADGLKTTKVAELALTSAHIWNCVTAYKRELYATWFAFQEVFEYLSKDVRGDDFWAISPREFRNPILQALGPEAAGILLAHFIEKHARMISSKPEYRSVGFFGAHVAVGAAEIKIITLGIQSRQCIDVDAPYMSRLHRIRSEAQPGSILVDSDDKQTEKALRMETLFSGQKPFVFAANELPFKDLASLPKVALVTEISESPEIIGLEKLALNLANEPKQHQQRLEPDGVQIAG